MTSKEALESWFNVISTNDKIRWEEHYKVIKKDLEVLEILKKYLYYDNKTHFIKMKQIRKSTFNFDYEDLKEWLDE